MHGHEIRPGDAIAVDKNADRSGTAKNRPVADLREPKATILVPNMDQPLAQSRHPGLNELPRRRTRAVVSHDHFEVSILLTCQRSQHRVERILAIEGRNDDGNKLSHFPGFFPTFSTQPYHPL